MDFKEFGKTIANLRKEQKISQKQLSEDLSISRATISSLENGRGVDVGLRKVLQIVDYLDFEISIQEKSKFPVFEDLLNER